MAEPQSPTGSRLVAEIAEAERAERTRLADRLHDEGLQLVLAARQEIVEVRDGDPQALDALQGDLEEATEALRSLTSAMHEDVLAGLPLADALERIGADAARRGRFALEVDVAPAAVGVHDALVRDIARELLANAARHARATRVHLEVLAPDDHVLVRVTDDGRGLDRLAQIEAERSGHLGLRRLRRIVEELGGVFATETPAGGGTRASARLPVAALAAQGSLEDRLQEERRWTSALVASLQDGLVVFRDGECVQANDQFCAMTGFSRGELLGTTPDDYPFWSEADRAFLRTTVQDAHARGGLEQEVDLVRANGEAFPALCSSARMDDAGGTDIGMVVTVKDLTERRRAEERQRLELELRSTIETTRRLTGVLVAVGDGVLAVLEALGRLMVDHLGWANVVVNLRDADRDHWEIAWGSSTELAEALAGTSSRDADWEDYVRPQFLRRGTYFVKAGEVVHSPGSFVVPEWEAPGHPDAWQAEDLLVVPMRAADGTLRGLVSVECPASKLRPTDTELDALAAAGEHAAAALELARSQEPAA